MRVRDVTWVIAAMLALPVALVQALPIPAMEDAPTRTNVATQSPKATTNKPNGVHHLSHSSATPKATAIRPNNIHFMVTPPGHAPTYPAEIPKHHRRAVTNTASTATSNATPVAAIPANDNVSPDFVDNFNTFIDQETFDTNFDPPTSGNMHANMVEKRSPSPIDEIPDTYTFVDQDMFQVPPTAQPEVVSKPRLQRRGVIPKPKVKIYELPPDEYLPVQYPPQSEDELELYPADPNDPEADDHIVGVTVEVEENPTDEEEEPTFEIKDVDGGKKPEAKYPDKKEKADKEDKPAKEGKDKKNTKVVRREEGEESSSEEVAEQDAEEVVEEEVVDPEDEEVVEEEVVDPEDKEVVEEEVEDPEDEEEVEGEVEDPEDEEEVEEEGPEGEEAGEEIVEEIVEVDPASDPVDESTAEPSAEEGPVEEIVILEEAKDGSEAPAEEPTEGEEQEPEVVDPSTLQDEPPGGSFYTEFIDAVEREQHDLESTVAEEVAAETPEAPAKPLEKRDHHEDLEDAPKESEFYNKFIEDFVKRNQLLASRAAIPDEVQLIMSDDITIINLEESPEEAGHDETPREVVPTKYLNDDATDNKDEPPGGAFYKNFLDDLEKENKAKGKSRENKPTKARREENEDEDVEEIVSDEILLIPDQVVHSPREVVPAEYLEDYEGPDAKQDEPQDGKFYKVFLDKLEKQQKKHRRSGSFGKLFQRRSEVDENSTPDIYVSTEPPAVEETNSNQKRDVGEDEEEEPLFPDWDDEDETAVPIAARGLSEQQGEEDPDSVGLISPPEPLWRPTDEVDSETLLERKRRSMEESISENPALEARSEPAVHTQRPSIPEKPRKEPIVCASRSLSGIPALLSHPATRSTGLLDLLLAFSWFLLSVCGLMSGVLSLYRQEKRQQSASVKPKPDRVAVLTVSNLLALWVGVVGCLQVVGMGMMGVDYEHGWGVGRYLWDVVVAGEIEYPALLTALILLPTILFSTSLPKRLVSTASSFQTPLRALLYIIPISLPYLPSLLYTLSNPSSCTLNPSPLSVHIPTLLLVALTSSNLPTRLWTSTDAQLDLQSREPYTLLQGSVVSLIAFWASFKPLGESGVGVGVGTLCVVAGVVCWNFPRGVCRVSWWGKVQSGLWMFGAWAGVVGSVVKMGWLGAEMGWSLVGVGCAVGCMVGVWKWARWGGVVWEDAEAGGRMFTFEPESGISLQTRIKEAARLNLSGGAGGAQAPKPFVKTSSLTALLTPALEARGSTAHPRKPVPRLSLRTKLHLESLLVSWSAPSAPQSVPLPQALLLAEALETQDGVLEVLYERVCTQWDPSTEEGGRQLRRVLVGALELGLLVVKMENAYEDSKTSKKRDEDLEKMPLLTGGSVGMDGGRDAGVSASGKMLGRMESEMSALGEDMI
ncbi:hypothetical protein HDV05_000094 [Chytridiales sp. JEL 0842]|nr:hypothetical protein HDV05_000094 [Chytridiales sp. JEL 0842]